MAALKKYISGLPYPIFLLNSSADTIFYSNEVAASELRIESNSELHLNKHVRFLTHESGERFAQLNHKWYQANTQKFDLPDDNFTLLELTDIEGIPDYDSVKSWKNMIAVMLHRLRSPLTGISGYLEMLEDEVEANTFSKRFESIHKGFNHIYDLMDELEIFYALSPEYDDSEYEEVNIHTLLNEVLIGFSSEQQLRIKPEESITSSISKNTNPNALKKILIALLDNALEHSDDDNIEVSYSPEHNGSISIKNNAAPLDTTIKDQIFHPFVTSRATNLGIGLPIAMIHAFQIGGIILLSEEEGSLKFTLQFPLSWVIYLSAIRFYADRRSSLEYARLFLNPVKVCTWHKKDLKYLVVNRSN